MSARAQGRHPIRSRDAVTAFTLRLAANILKVNIGGSMTDSEGNEISAEDRQFMAEMGMTEVEPGRFMSGWQASDQESQEFFESLTSSGMEQLDLLARAGRVSNEFELEHSGSSTAVSVQRLSPDALLPEQDFIEVFVGIRNEDSAVFESLEGSLIEEGFEAAHDKFPSLIPPDAIAVALRKLGVKCRTIDEHPAEVSSAPSAGQGFRTAHVLLPGGTRKWAEAS